MFGPLLPCVQDGSQRYAARHAIELESTGIKVNLTVEPMINPLHARNANFHFMEQSRRRKRNPGTMAMASKRTATVSAASEKANQPKVIEKLHLPVYLRAVGWAAAGIMALAAIGMFLTSG